MTDTLGYHWTATGDIGGVIDVPALPEHPGYYCSSDAGVVSEQLHLIEQTGIQVLFVGWWGEADLESKWKCGLPPYPDSHINEGIEALFKGIHENSSPVKVGLIVEPFTGTHKCKIPPEGVADAHRAILNYIETNYYGRYPDHVFQWEGHPLLITFDPMTIAMPVESPFTFTYTLKHWTGAPKTITTTTEGWDWFFGPPQDSVTKGRSDDGVVFVYPRFDEYPAWLGGASYITWTPRSIDPLLGQCAYARQWGEVIVSRDAISMVVVYGWNLYGEQAYIEPTKATEQHPERRSIESEYITRTREYYGALLQPEPVLPRVCRGYLPDLRR